MRAHIRLEILKSGLKKREVAKEIGVTPGYLSGVLQDGSTRRPSMKILKRFGLTRQAIRTPVKIVYRINKEVK